MPELEERQARIEGILEQMDKRLSSLESRMGSLEARLERLESRIDKLEAKVDSNFKWLIGILFTMWVTIILAVLFKT